MAVQGFGGRSLGLKLILIGALVALLGIPLLFVNILAWERSNRADEAAREVGQAQGGPQTLRGPFLLIPVDVPEIVAVNTPAGAVQETRIVEQTIIISPDTLDITVELDISILSRAIYDVPVYTAQLRLGGAFSPGDLADLVPERGEPIWERARLVIGVSDLRGFRDPVRFSMGEQLGEAVFEPGSAFDQRGGRGDTRWHGVTAPLSLEPGAAFNFDAALTFTGAGRFSLIASGRDTTVHVSGNWPHPGFAGAYLPATREVAEDGFSASWQIPYLARGVPARWLEGERFSLAQADRSAFTINLTDPADGYAQVSRALKYAVFFLGFTVLTVFLLEAAGGTRIHAAQYLLIGLSQVIFYLILLAQSEHQSVLAAYLTAAGATTVLTAAYAATAFRSAARGATLLALLAMVYGLQYALLILEDYALLIGAWLAFAALALSMWVTRNVDWYDAAMSGPPAAKPASGA
jgi:inner membrane protein